MDSIAEILGKTEYYLQTPPAAALPFPLPKGAAVASFIDHTLLKPEASSAQIRRLCEEARAHGFAAVCVNPAYTSLAAGLLADSPVKVCVVVGFPLGATLPTLKVIETLACLNAGAHEIDMVINIGALKSEAYGQVLNEVRAVSETAHAQGAHLKVILETGLLSQAEKITACLISQAAGADFVKTSTGFVSTGATVEDVALLRRVVGAQMGVKAAGGIRSYADACAMIAAGANRLGASAGVQILREAIAAGERNP
jgi:deoxyribose-phosphate aldolase